MSFHKLISSFIVGTATLGLGVISANLNPQNAAAQGNDAQASNRISVSTGKLAWADERVLSSRIPGIVAERLVKDGDLVEPDQILAILDNREAKIDYATQSLVSKADTGVKIAQRKTDEYVARRDSAGVLIQRQAISEEDYRLAWVNVAVNELQAKQEVEKLDVEKLKADKAKVILDDHTIVSPIRGRVAKCFKREREAVTPSEPQMFRIVATDKLWAEGHVKSYESPRVNVGQTVEVEPYFVDLTGGGNKKIKVPGKFTGKIVFIETDIGFSQQTLIVRVEIDNQLDSDGNELLKAGMAADMSILVNNAPPAPKNVQ